MKKIRFWSKTDDHQTSFPNQLSSERLFYYLCKSVSPLNNIFKQGEDWKVRENTKVSQFYIQHWTEILAIWIIKVPDYLLTKMFSWTTQTVQHFKYFQKFSECYPLFANLFQLEMNYFGQKFINKWLKST